MIDLILYYSQMDLFFMILLIVHQQFLLQIIKYFKITKFLNILYNHIYLNF